ncbi:MAG TPA: hypothetical protein VMM18_06595 [Gemmatimonadaceae bacterium]|nr:hypothetical protein [Gemmatimonadaceae bacterium]
MTRRRIAFATYEREPYLTPDDRLAAPALAALGVEVVPAIWTDGAVDWGVFDAVVLRSTWDYHRRITEYRRWLDLLERSAVPVWNPLALVRWNSDKRYLRDLAARGVDTVPTVWLERGSPSIGEVLDEQGWREAVVKPVVAATAYRTIRVSGSTATADESAVRVLLEHGNGEALLQPFLPEIETEGEWSLVFFAGAFSHAALKRPAPGDFRVQTEFGGDAIPAEPPAGVMAAAERALADVATPWLYARVDGVRVADGRFLLMELELLEPSLFLGLHDQAPARFAAAIRRLLAG